MRSTIPLAVALLLVVQMPGGAGKDESAGIKVDKEKRTVTSDAKIAPRKLAYLKGEIYLLAVTAQPNANGGGSAPLPASETLPDGAVARLGTLRLRHPGPARAVSLSPSGKLVASGGIDKHIRVCDAATGKELRDWDAGQGAITWLLFSPDGSFLASAGADKTIRLWNANDGKMRLQLDGEVARISTMAFSADGKNLIAADGDGTACLWEFATGKERRQWQVFQGKEIPKIGGHDEYQFAAFASSPDAKTLAWGTWHVKPIAGGNLQYHGQVAVWDAATGKERCRLHGVEIRPRLLAFSPDGKALALLLDTGQLSLWEAATGKLRRQLDDTPTDAEELVFSPDGSILAAAGGGFATLWDTTSGKKLRRLGPGPDNRPDPFGTGVSFSADGKTLSVTAHARTTLWNAQTGKPTLALPGHQGAVLSVLFARDGKSLASLAATETRIWNAATWTETAVVLRGSADPPVAAFSADGRELTYQSEGDAVRFVERPSGKPLPRFGPDDFAFWHIPFAPDGKTVAVVRSDRSLCLYDAAAGKALLTIDAKTAGVLSPVVFSPDGKLLAWVNLDNTVSVVDAARGQRVHHLGKGYPKETRGALVAKGVHTVAFSPDKKALAAGGEYDNTIRLWDLQTGKAFREFVGHTGPVGAIAFSPDGRWLASTGRWERAIRLWDVATGKERRQFQAHEDWTTSLAFSPNGKLLASSSLDGTVLVWDVP
jgi:WD40 repeat protein